MKTLYLDLDKISAFHKNYILERWDSKNLAYNYKSKRNDLRFRFNFKSNDIERSFFLINL